MLRPGGLARPALARTFTTELSWAGSPRNPTSVMTGWFIVIYHRRTFTGWTGSIMGCERITRMTRIMQLIRLGGSLALPRRREFLWLLNHVHRVETQARH